MKWNAKTKKTVVAAGAAVTAAAIAAGLVFGLRGGSKTVAVYPFSMVGMTEFWGDNQESYGPVTTDRIQTVFLSDTQTITEVKVQQGDSVKKGDVLATYDTTLSQLQLERKRLDAERARLQVQEAREELARINQLVPMPPMEPDPEPPEETEPDYGDPLNEDYVINPKNIGMDGSTPQNPLVCWIKSTTPVNSILLRELYDYAERSQSADVPSHGSAVPTEETEIPEETSQETTEPEAATEPTEAEETVYEEPPEQTLSAFELFAMRAPEELKIYSDVDNGDVIRVMRGNGVTLTFSSSITDWEHSDYVTWQLDQPGNGPLSGSNNGRGYTVSGTADKEGEFHYIVQAKYSVEGLETLTAKREFTLKVIPEETENRKIYVALMMTADDLEKAPCTMWQGMEVTAYDGAGFDITFVNDIPGIETFFPEEPIPEASLPEMEYNSGLTAAQIVKLREEQEAKIRELTVAAAQTEAEYDLMEREFADGCIRASLDGEVVSLLDAEEARQSKSPMIKVSGGGGFYVQGSVSELEWNSLSIGQEVTVNDWNTGMTYTGQIRSIDDFPVEAAGGNAMGNPNASYYPFRVFIDGEADLQEGSYVSMTYSTAQAQNGVYLENPFLRTDGPQPYVYVRGKGGKLEKRVVSTGRSLWGMYTEIRSGLTDEDFLAFPYGKAVKTGAATEEGDLSALYGY